MAFYLVRIVKQQIIDIFIFLPEYDRILILKSIKRINYR